MSFALATCDFNFQFSIFNSKILNPQSASLLILPAQRFFHVADLAFGFRWGVAGVGILLRGAGAAAALGVAELFGIAALGGVLGAFHSGHG
ncbi:MAG TPA: hypothetical protein VHW00_24040 [Thermoanaerobaculia bacterium]|nr:hypothetical protein [Thermoanaerobaculia bacterium]